MKPIRPINPGALRQRITILERVKGQSPTGAVTNEWVEFKKTHAAMLPLLGKELYSAMTADILVKCKFVMRYIDGVCEGMRIRHKGQVYDIISAQNVNALNVELVCYCKESERNWQNNS